MSAKMQPRITDRSREATSRVTQITETNLHGLTQDTAKMARAMMGDAFKKASTGALENSVKTRRDGALEHVVTTDAKNQAGVGYGAKKEWGYHDRGGTKRKGRHIMLRACWGMRKRYERGDRWKD